MSMVGFRTISFRLGKTFVKKKTISGTVVSICAVAWVVHSVGAAPPDFQPVYVGVKVCAECHEGNSLGDQCGIWAQSAHAHAYAALHKPEARQIARLSGVAVEPDQSRICLGCHATAAEAEPWELDPTFSIRDGVQCEKCHGPGSEYADAAIMRDRQKAMERGLRMPGLEGCIYCHAPKESHQRVLGKSGIDIAKGWQSIKHPVPANASLSPLERPAPPMDRTQPALVGAAVCADCHDGAHSGWQFSKWLESKHAGAYACLGSTEGQQLAKKRGVEGDPRTAGECLKCHATAYHVRAATIRESYSLLEGVGCEACHGPGSQHVESRRRDPSQQDGSLKKPARETCLECHQSSPDKPFDFDQMLAKIAHPSRPDPSTKNSEVVYKTPVNIAVSPNCDVAVVACEASNTIALLDLNTMTVRGEIPVGHQPHDVAFTPDGLFAFVSNRLDDSVSVVDLRAKKVVRTIPVGDEPHGLLTDLQGKYLYVCNFLSDDISVVDLKSFKVVKTLSAGRGPWSLSLSPDGKWLVVTNIYSRFVPFRTEARTELTIVDTSTAQVVNRPVAEGANGLRGVTWDPKQRFALFTLARHKNVIPITRLLQGWTVTNGLGIFWADGRIDQVLLDEPGECFPDPHDVVISPDGLRAFVTSSGNNRVAVIDLKKLETVILSYSGEDRKAILPNHLGPATEFVIKQIDVGHCPRGLALDKKHGRLLVANSLDDSIGVIDIQSLDPVGTIDLGGPKIITRERLGERIFHSAKNTFHRQFSCASCHPDGHVEGLTYDIEDDIGVNPVDNRTLRGILDTSPFKWEGINPTLSRQCGTRLAVFFTRIQPFTPEELTALDYYICTIPLAPNRHRPVGAPLTPAQRRGRAIFERIYTNDGRLIPPENRCVTCHPPPLYTDRRSHDVGTKMKLDRHGVFDTPQLLNIYNSAPYLHNGIAPTLEEIWTVHNPYDTHGVTNDLTKDQLNDLIEYLKTL